MKKIEIFGRFIFGFFAPIFLGLAFYGPSSIMIRYGKGTWAFLYCVMLICFISALFFVSYSMDESEKDEPKAPPS